MNYTLKNGMIINKHFIRNLEHSGLSEAEIASDLGISRQWLYRIRKRLGIPDRGRSDRGVSRKSDKEKRESRNSYMRGRYKKLAKSEKYCHICKVEITVDNIGLRGNGKYLCKNCL